MKHPVFQHLTKKNKKIIQLSNKSIYHQSYPAILSMTQELSDNSDATAIYTLATTVYGWMPTILKQIDLCKFLMPRDKIFSRIRSVGSFEEAINLVQDMTDGPPINNSWVGTSKFLHFVNPEWFAIWDSKVALHFDLKSHALHKRDHYIDYLKYISKTITENPNSIDCIGEEIHKKFGYRPTKTRSLELILFLSPPPCELNK